MSGWREKGYVEDSDEGEDEDNLSDFEGWNQDNTHQRVGRVEETGHSRSTAFPDPTSNETPRPQYNNIPTCTPFSKSPTPSPLTPVDQVRRQPPNSAGPVQPSLSSSSPTTIRLSSHRRTESPASVGRLLQDLDHHNSIARESSQILANTVQDSKFNTSRLLGEFGIAPLSDDSSDESELSDPPSDLEIPSVEFATPHRRTEVQVVIPSSTSFQQQQQQLSQHARTREFRQRKPIQLHPYALEGEIYRREVQSRGLKPVPREREVQPQREPRPQNGESQEEEFDPDKSPSSSPPEAEIPVSTPAAAPRSRRARSTTSSASRSRLAQPQKASSTKLRLPNSVKRRKIQFASTQAVPLPRSSSVDSITQWDIWSPPPPSSSSKTTRQQLHAATPKSNLPTPATSAIYADRDSRLGSDEEPIVPSIQASSSGLRRPTRIIISDSSSSDSESSACAETQDQELKKVGRKIKGVLPASWLRIDRQAQEQRKRALERAKERERERAHQANRSVYPTDAQKGVAQKVFKNRKAPVAPADLQSIVLSSPSQSDSEQPITQPGPHAQNDIVSSYTSAADRVHAEDNLSDMENDQLPLFTLGGGPKRKRQPRVTEIFAKEKRRRLTDGHGTPSYSSKFRRGADTGTRKHTKSKSRRAQPAAMSVIDIDLSPSRGSSKDYIPQFLRVARRQARQRPDLARQSPKLKQIRLHTARDTEDAQSTLVRWKQGALQQNTTVKPTPRPIRRPLVDRPNNQQYEHRLPGRSGPSASRSKTPRSSNCNNLPEGLQLFSRTPRQAREPSKGRANYPTSRANQQEKRIQQPSLKPAQLEINESGIGRIGTSSFAKGLHQLVSRSSVRPGHDHIYENPMLSRFLADGASNAPDMPAEIGIDEVPLPEEPKMVPSTRRRLKKKSKTTRVDVNARQYRQPSEPPAEDSLIHGPDPTLSVDKEQEQVSLQGLGPFGTRYPVTFDITSLPTETYFHTSTFVGSDEFRKALTTHTLATRNLDEPAGYCTITNGTQSVRCGPWDDETYSALHSILQQIWSLAYTEADNAQSGIDKLKNALVQSNRLTRSIISYVTTCLSFHDTVDRIDFAEKLLQMSNTIFDHILAAEASVVGAALDSNVLRNTNRGLSYVLVLLLQLRNISRNWCGKSDHERTIIDILTKVTRKIVSSLVQHGVREISTFLDNYKGYAARMNGIQEKDVFPETMVICLHALHHAAIPGLKLWDLISRELTLYILTANKTQAFEYVWATISTLLPFTEIDISGFPSKSDGLSIHDEGLPCVKALLKRLWELYPTSSQGNRTSLNDYVRANLARCHRLIYHWHWRRPDQLLHTMFDFFGKNGLRQLYQESNEKSAPFLADLTSIPTLNLIPHENSFHIALKCLALGLQGMTHEYPEKKIRSFVFRTIPNHGRAYPKDQDLSQENLVALRNHHDLLSTLYWAAPPACRPKLDHIRSLVNHEESHREACRVSVRAWANLTSFQLSTSEPYASLQPFAFWHRDIMRQTLKQYRAAKTEADDYLKSTGAEGTADVSVVMVRQTMEKNQQQVIATLQDSIEGMRKALKTSKDPSSLQSFIIDSDILHLLELPYLKDQRLLSLTRSVLQLLREYTLLNSPVAEETQETNDESQDYGDFPDLDDLDDLTPEPKGKFVGFRTPDFMQSPLWQLLSNAFGAEVAPDENFLMDCVDTWIHVAEGHVQHRRRTWAYYLDPFSQMSWQQLRQTDQTRKFGHYFLSVVLERNPSAYENNRQQCMRTLLVGLADRESLLRFQYRLLHAIIKIDSSNELLRNIPFYVDRTTSNWDINAEALRSRRLSLLSCIFSNMRDEVQTLSILDPSRAIEVQRGHADMLKDFMNAMKNNYQQIKQGTTVTGAYVDFVHKVIQFLKQYTSEFCTVLPFFTDSIAFPLPATDPTYVVGRLRGYAPKAHESGVAKQLSVFLQTVVQQAAADNQQSYLVGQLTAALCTNDSHSKDAMSLRFVLLQGIWPVYIEEAFKSLPAFVIAEPILRTLPQILDVLIFDLRIAQTSSVNSVLGCILSIINAFTRGIESVNVNDDVESSYSRYFSQLSYVFESFVRILPLLDYIASQTSSSPDPIKSAIVAYMELLLTYAWDLTQGIRYSNTPVFPGNANTPATNQPHGNIQRFCKQGLKQSLKENWSVAAGELWFGNGRAKRMIVREREEYERERARLVDVIKRAVEGVVHVYGDKEGRCKDDGDARCELII